MTALKIFKYSILWFFIYLLFLIFAFNDGSPIDQVWVIMSLTIPFVVYMVSIAVRDRPVNKDTLAYMVVGAFGGGIILFLVNFIIRVVSYLKIF